MLKIDDVFGIVFNIFMVLAFLQIPLTFMALISKSILLQYGCSITSSSAFSGFSGSKFWREAEIHNRILNNKFIKYSILLRKLVFIMAALSIGVLVLSVNFGEKYVP